jgi:hypothetical protein
MDIIFEIWSSFDESPEARSWITVYHAFFELLKQSFCNVHSLRVTIRIPALEDHNVNHSDINGIVAPWDTLALSREWKRLQFCVPFDWCDMLIKIVGTHSQWELTETCWYVSYPDLARGALRH